MNLYDDEIAYNDYCFGALVDHTRKLGVYNDTLFIIIGDHGEAFYEHGVYSHGHTPFEEVIHVPMVMKFPQNQYQGTRVKSLVTLVDIFPTVTGVGGVTIEEKTLSFLQGQNLIPLLTGELTQARAHVFSDTQILDVHNRYLSVRGDRWKYIRVQRPGKDKKQTLLRAVRHVLGKGLLWDVIRSPRHFLRNYFRTPGGYLFDLMSDPFEQHNLVTTQLDVTEEMQRLLNTWELENEKLASENRMTLQDYEESDVLQKHLEKLGYL